MKPGDALFVFRLRLNILLIFVVGGVISCDHQEIYINPLPPAVSSIYPDQGKAGSSLFIYGENFSPSVYDDQVRIGEQPLEIYKADSTSLEVIIPERLESGYVQVIVKGKAKMGPFFTYLPTISVGTYSGSGLIGLQDGKAFESRFNIPRGLTLDQEGNIYVADQGNNAIRKISPDGGVITLAGDGIPGFKDGDGEHARFSQPGALVINGDGVLFIADFGNNAIRKLTPGGMVTTLAGDSIPGYTEGTGSAAQFHGPAGLAFDKNGNLFVADFFNNVIRLVTMDGAVTTFAGTGTGGNADGDASTCQFLGPAGLCVGPDNTVYISDWGNFRVRTMTQEGYVSTLAGSTAGYADGPGSSAQFNTVFSTASDDTGNVYVADGFNNLIREIDTLGNVSTLAGATESGFKNGGPGEARFNGPVGVAFNNEAHALYVAEWYNHRIRVIHIY